MTINIPDDNYALGIDLGTSNSSASIMYENKPIVIPNEFGLLNTPSYASFLEPNKRLVGQLSKMNILSNKNTIFNCKRFIGKKFSNELKNEIEKKFPFIIMKDENSNKIKIETNFINDNIIEKKYYYPEQISAIILRKIKEDAEYYLSKHLFRIINKKIEIKKAVITIPAYFNPIQRKETKQAAEIAGLEVIGMINEPTAASLAYGLYKFDNPEEYEKKIMVLDFGGGTLDFTLLTFIKNNNGITCDIDGSFGDTDFGGQDFDNALMDKILEKKNINIKDLDEYQKLRLKLACEKAKIELSNNESTNIIIEEFFNSQDINFKIAQKDEKNDISSENEKENSIKDISIENNTLFFLDICKPLFKKFEDKIKEFINNCNLDEKKKIIKDIILIGGTTKIPEIKRIIEKEFPNSKIKDEIDPTLSVAKGSAIYASMIIKPKEYYFINLNDVTNFSIGTNCFSREKNCPVMDKIIKRYSTLPARGEEMYTTSVDNQTSIRNDIYIGESEILSENLFLGTFKIINLPKKNKGEVIIKLTFILNKNSILEAEAIDLSNTDNYKTTKILIQEPKNIDDKEMKDLKDQENNSEIIEFPGYEQIKDNIIEKQTKIESLEKEDNDSFLEIIKMLLSLIPYNIEKINIQIYFSYVKYIFSLTKIYLKNNKLHFDECIFLKERFVEIFEFLQLLNEKNNYNNTYQQNNKKYNNIFTNVLFELLENIADNPIIYDYCFSIIIESYNSKMKEYYFRSEASKDFEKELLICKDIHKIIKKLLNKIKIPNAIQEGVKTEIVLYPLRIDIKKFLLNYNNNKKKIDFDALNAKKIALDFIGKIEKLGKNTFFRQEIEELKPIAGIRTKFQEKLKCQDDMKYLYELLKHSPPTRKMKYKNIMSEKDILEELENYIEKYKNGQSLEKEIHANLFLYIFFKDGVLSIDETNREFYINTRLEEEKRHEKINTGFYKKFDKYCEDYASGVRYYFLDDPYGTIVDIYNIYDKSVSSKITENILLELQQLKAEIKENKDSINMLLEDSKDENEYNYFKFYFRKISSSTHTS